MAPELSHLILKADSPGLSDKVREFLGMRGIRTESEHTFWDDEGQCWLIFSTKASGTRSLVLELIEQGFSDSVAGIDATEAPEKGVGTPKGAD